MECDVAVLGGGPGGYPAAIRAAQLGANVVLIEQDRVGGTCITVGCIPTKAWVQTAHGLKDARETFAQIGVRVSDPELDFGQAQKNKVRPSRPATKKTTTFIRSVPATMAIAKNGGKPIAAETKVSSPLISGRPWMKSLQRTYCAWRRGEAICFFNHGRSRAPRQT